MRGLDNNILQKVVNYIEVNLNTLLVKKDDSRFYLINFYPAGETVAFIYCVIKGSA